MQSSKLPKVVRFDIILPLIAFVLLNVWYIFSRTSISVTVTPAKLQLATGNNVKITDFLQAVVTKSYETSPTTGEAVRKALGQVLQSIEYSSEVYSQAEANVIDVYKARLSQISDTDPELTNFTIPFMKLVKSYTALTDIRSTLNKLENEVVDRIVNDLLRNGTFVEDIAAESKNSSRSVYLQNLLTAVTPRDIGDTNMVRARMRGQSLIENTCDTGFSVSYLLKDGVGIESADLDRLRMQHRNVTQNIRTFPAPTSDIYSGNGIVIPANKNFLHSAVCVVSQLRNIGSKYPVEVLLDSKDDYDYHTCEVILPKMSAQCLVMDELVTFPKLQQGFQLKVLAILLSSFENILLLDADNWPVRNPDYLFDSEVFSRDRFLLWPDAWQKKTSPLFYEIAEIELGEPIRRDGIANDKSAQQYFERATDETLLSDLDGALPYRSVESGQLVISKIDRFSSLALALFYNLRGPDLYYPLLYQGSAGLGDRETFIAAAEAMGQKYYLSEYGMDFAGVVREAFIDKRKYFDTTTMVQRDPEEAFKFGKSWRMWLKKKNLDTRLSPYQQNKYTVELRRKFFLENSHLDANPQPLFLHVNNPKVSVVSNELSKKGTYDYRQRYIRSIGEMDQLVGKFDWELRFHAINKWVTCEVLTNSEFWARVGLEQKKLCEKLTRYVDSLKQDTTDADAAEFGWRSVGGAPEE